MTSTRLNWIRIACVITIVGACQFVILVGVAMCLYPGGHPWDASAEGYTFFTNTFSDLGRKVSVSGESNKISSAIFSFSMIVGTVSVLCGWFAIPELFPRQKLIALLMRIAGAGFACGMIGVALTPADITRFGHMTSTAFMGAPALIGLALCCAGLYSTGRALRIYTLMTVVLLVLAGVHFSQFVWHFYLGGEWTPAAPFVQRLLSIWAIVWAIAISAKHLRST